MSHAFYGQRITDLVVVYFGSLQLSEGMQSCVALVWLNFQNYLIHLPAHAVVAQLDKDMPIGEDENADIFVAESPRDQKPIENWLELFKLSEAGLNGD